MEAAIVVARRGGRRVDPFRRSHPRDAAPSDGRPSAEALQSADDDDAADRPDRADAREDRRCDPGRPRLPVRAEVGRLPRARVSHRRRDAAAESRPEAAEPLFPRARGGAARRVARRLRARRRDRRRVGARPRLRRLAAAHPSGRVADREARAGDAGRASSRSTCSARMAARRWTLPQAERRALPRAAARPGDEAPRRSLQAHADDARPRRSGALARRVRRRGARRRRREARVRDLPARQARDAEDQARPHAPTASSPASAGTRTRPTRSARCCSACTTTPACCITSASRRRSRWRRGGRCSTSSRRCATTRSRAIRGATGRRRR